ncbi:RagB/SusD family nutrient uptake outer membrane protein [uncultured Draconibacterium sp.]|uniref:RagB/SusD family nutrient uptake outer membrane protein n=1 Tax=uncultured Draconibacterium sp. TaxID=1573823 RepID=UPI0029BFBB6C|nr:RagB/SusD family nutrient uptake outer membrane protein [uncultured Draconibacterium sp.]
MKKLIYIFFAFGLILASCDDFLEVDPIAQETEESFFNTPENAIYAVNACYDIIGMTEGPGPDFQWLAHNYEFFFGDFLSDDAEKGSKEADFQELQEMVEWRVTPGSGVLEGLWIKCYDGIYRCNSVLKQLANSKLDEALKTRLEGEALFVRGYFYAYLVKVYGGAPVFTEPLTPDQFGTIERASYHETFEQAIADFKMAVDRLPEKSGYDASDLGRATKGAARAYLARTLMYQIGMDAESSTSWDDVYAQTSAIINSGEYQLASNFATIFEMDGENNSGSIFELQFVEGTTPNAPEKTGTNFHQFQGNRTDWGWGFNNPSVNLFETFEDNDPRLGCTVYGESFNGGVVHGVKRDYDLTAQMTPYMNRKAALEPAYRPAIGKSSAGNVRKLRYAEVLLTHAEAAFHTSKEGEAKQMLNMIRERARNSTYAKGWVEGTVDYTPTGFSGNLPEITSSGQELLEAIWKERRVELAMEAQRFWDLVRTGRYLEALDLKKETFKTSDGETLRYENVDLRGNCLARSIDGPNGHKVPLMPIPLREVEDWGLTQNVGY